LENRQWLCSWTRSYWLSAHRAEDEEIVPSSKPMPVVATSSRLSPAAPSGRATSSTVTMAKPPSPFQSSDSKGVRIARKAEKEDLLGPEHRALLAKIRQGTATDEEQRQYRTKHEMASKRVRDLRPDELFSISEIIISIPEKALIEPSINCALCGEPTMSTKMDDQNGKKVCRGCLF